MNVMSGGSIKNPKEKGYNIPIDMSFAFHTDAGTTLKRLNNRDISLYTRLSNGESVFPQELQGLQTDILPI